MAKIVYISVSCAGLPLVGNLFQLSDDIWFRFAEWKEAYGPIVYLNVAGQSVVVLNDHKTAADLLDRRASIYSDRPRNIVASQILSGGLMIVFTPFNDVWKRMRRAAHEGLGKRTVPTFRVLQRKEALHLAFDLLTDPARWDQHTQRATASLVLSVLYGKPPIRNSGDPTIRRINEFTERLVRAAYPGAHLVEIFTWMKYLPSWMAKWKRDAQAWYKVDSAMFIDLFNSASKVKVDGEEHDTFSTSVAEDRARHNLSNEESSWLSGTLYAAGAETTAAVMLYFMQAMVLYPEVQARAQEELDRVLAPGAAPTFDDYEQLPYIRAIVKESLRWKPIDPIGKLMQDDWYEGYYIPKGSIVVGNVWSLNRDPEVYGADAADFNPGRHLNREGGFVSIPDTKEESHVTYGFGRRICVGRHVANDSLFIEIATILWACKIEPIKDANGKPVPIDADGFINTGLVVRPKPFQVSVKPRFESAAAVLAETIDRS
ncbi:cytochrome P450 [Punctularia strigosozonata HHB-11173 SS5]|uniref:cytochrome P450 n=1 Tax=Punctularia strigosozonata (strain HHB-11173) TaxID=741275 RepID=UPI0004416D00|nr:cytochrome P450 [Punctularia strigosozonata HHB-11173 SS5]EIN11999.1 cytochrome P450 [Punctularia strigosozonata HHB-11173 SS5]